MGRMKDTVTNDFYDTMTPHWSNAMAKQYNKDTEEDMLRSVTEEVEGFNGTTAEDISELIKKAINPKHYKDVAYGYQYIQLMIPMLERFDGITSHLMGQTYKYLMRAGNKDVLIQDLRKARWYLDALIEYQQSGKITVEE